MSGLEVSVVVEELSSSAKESFSSSSCCFPFPLLSFSSRFFCGLDLRGYVFPFPKEMRAISWLLAATYKDQESFALEINPSSPGLPRHVETIRLSSEFHFSLLKKPLCPLHTICTSGIKLEELWPILTHFYNYVMGLSTITYLLQALATSLHTEPFWNSLLPYDLSSNSYIFKI